MAFRKASNSYVIEKMIIPDHRIIISTRTAVRGKKPDLIH